MIISPDGADGSLNVRQDAGCTPGCSTVTKAATLDLPPDRHVYIHVARGSVEINGQRLQEGDGARVRDEQRSPLEPR